jgi:flavin-dependent dehydrogenase
VLAVDMRYLVERLQTLAEDAGAELHPGVAVNRFDGAGLETNNGRIEADVYVDASGLDGARLLDQPRVPAVDVCVAAQQVRHLLDRDAARAFFLRHRARQGDTLVFAGIAGGYSIVEVRFDEEQVALLTGSIPALGHPSGPELLEGFAAEHSWIGPAVFGGARTIPLRRALVQVGRGRVAAIGDAAFQLYSAHGSGIAQQFVAARALADALADGRGTEGYNLDWERNFGGLVASADLFRRFTQRFTVDQMRRMMERRVLGEEVVQQALLQRSPQLSARSALRSARGLVRLPRVARRLAALLARMQLVRLHYRRYPARPQKLRGWTRRLELYSGVPEA